MKRRRSIPTVHPVLALAHHRLENSPLVFAQVVVQISRSKLLEKHVTGQEQPALTSTSEQKSRYINFQEDPIYSIESQPSGVPSAETRKAKPQIKVMCGQAFINGQLYCSTGVPDAG
jgi:hypothetical protein